MKIVDIIQEAAKSKISPKTGNEFIRFKVPSNFNDPKDIEKEKLKVARKIDAESRAFTGVDISGLIINGSRFNLYDPTYFTTPAKEFFYVYGVFTESRTGFSLIISKLLPKYVKIAKSKGTIFEKPFKWEPKKHDSTEEPHPRLAD